MKQQRVQVMVRSIHDNISEETIEHIYQGYYSFQNGTHFIRYEEIYDDTGDITNTGTCLLKIKDNTLYILKKGAITTRMQFDTSKNHFTPYQTPYGTFQLEIATEKLTMKQYEKNLHIMIHYQLNLDGQPFSQCRMEIEVKF